VKILITGGAGYKGCLLTEALIGAGHDVTILDNFMYGYEPIIRFGNKIKVINKDIRNIYAGDVAPYDIIYHLAGVSGYPACEANPHSARLINVESTAKLVSYLHKDQMLVYASTTSFYGKSGTLRTEESEPDPVSIYGVTKYEAEQICMDHPNTISFRFATIFGVSPRMRNDLMLNNFVYLAMTEGCLVLFDCDSQRPFLHVKDAIRAYKFAETIPPGVYNVGAGDMNYSKLALANAIGEHVKVEIIKAKIEDKDRRDYIIDFTKIEPHFKPGFDINYGINELINLYEYYKPFTHYARI